MRNKVATYLKSIPRYVWILLAIIVVGIFFRTYHFRDWLQFSPDEARDATVVGNAIEGKSALPLLGPQAGNTQFYLGPIYYQAEYVSGLIFGNEPDKFAYPDLFFSILTIPLLYFFLRKYFSISIALTLDALMSFSYFMIISSRFALNPNSIPFFTLVFLYALLEMVKPENKKSVLWPILLGISMGIGIQLHTLLFLIMPIVGIFVLIYLIKQKNISWKSFLLFLLFFAIVNYGQLMHEIITGGSNTAKLFKGAKSEATTGSALSRNAYLVGACQIQANAHIISSYENIEACGDIFKPNQSITKYTNEPGGTFYNGQVFISAAVVSVIFSLIGYILLLFFIKKETDKNRRNFLIIILLYSLVLFAVFIPVASQISMHYFNIVFFVPFVLLGLWMIIITRIIKNKKIANKLLIIIIAFLFILQGGVLTQAYHSYSSGNVSSAKKSIYGEIMPMVDYMIANSSQKEAIRIDGSAFYLKRFFKPFVYIAKKSGVDIAKLEKNNPISSGTSFFYIDEKKEEDVEKNSLLNGDIVLGSKQFQNIIIYTLLKQ